MGELAIFVTLIFFLFIGSIWGDIMDVYEAKLTANPIYVFLRSCAVWVWTAYTRAYLIPREVYAMIKGRAATDKEKREIIERLYRAWTMVPSLRFGQMLSDAINHAKPGADIYYVEDEQLARDAEKLLKDAMQLREKP